MVAHNSSLIVNSTMAARSPSPAHIEVGRAAVPTKKQQHIKLNFADLKGSSKLSLSKAFTRKTRRTTSNKAAELVPRGGEKSPLRGKDQLLKKLEKRRLGKQRKALAEVEKLYRGDPTVERAIKSYLVRRLLWKLKRRSPPGSCCMDCHDHDVRSKPDGVDAADMAVEQNVEQSQESAADNDSAIDVATPEAEQPPEKAETEAKVTTSKIVGSAEKKADVEENSKRKREADESQEQPPAKKNPFILGSSASTSTSESKTEKKEKSANDTSNRNKDADKSSIPDAATNEHINSNSVSSPRVPKPHDTPQVDGEVNGDSEVLADGALTSAESTAPKAETKKSKKHNLDVKDEESNQGEKEHDRKLKKAKTEGQVAPSAAAAATGKKLDAASMSPAQTNDKPKKTALKINREYYDQRQYEMVSNPLGFDDLVYEETRPRILMRNRKRRLPKGISGACLMSGGIGPDVVADASNNNSGAGGLSKRALKKQLRKQTYTKSPLGGESISAGNTANKKPAQQQQKHQKEEGQSLGQQLKQQQRKQRQHERRKSAPL
ncbi:hypothetical protein QBC46DRAFT_380752 [Diplogelasinospora grovesii]|uniref:Uncharacterized protein n=1 Tax=Diplogelasinospora grovesii TaxID=303347 RepID=A0AAN6S6T4_9PEZI|nr:hypothetical protein QBC46DRAFT_380752 [Diplogelasinospora grovesii]